VIKAKGKTVEGDPLFIFGLSQENVRRLMKGHAIAIDLRREYGERGVVIIVGGETEEAIRDELLKYYVSDKIEDWKNPNG
jgi:hypothetical protein